MRIPIYQVDAFTGAVFSGNPAAVCPLDRWLADPVLQAIAAENNVSETAYFVRNGEGYDLRWFTPAREIDLCGHATLASAFVIFERLDRNRLSVTFNTKSGPLSVRREANRLSMDFPSRPPERCEVPPALEAGLGRHPVETWKARDYMAVFQSEEDVRSLRPDMEKLATLDAFGVIATAPGTDKDFVSRFFAPRVGVPEDPVTGSAHCTLIPYWSKRLSRQRLSARQVSARGGDLECEDRGNRVTISGSAALFLEGTISV
jgi:PhzF family phenazine biosynthesis protein